MRVRTMILGASVLGVAGLWVVWAKLVNPRVVAARQTYNWAIVQGYVQFLEQYRQTHEKYPANLIEVVPAEGSNRAMWLAARDGYDHPLYYETNGARYLLASLGHDGVRDRGEYARVDAHDRRDNSPCYDADIDTAYSSDGVFQACGK